MRVISGKARRIQLKTIEGLDTRPTTDRIKETLFNILASDLYDCRFLDLFAGSGGIGIEALSRGARSAVFVENSRSAAACIDDNLKATHLKEQAEILSLDAVAAIRKLTSARVTFNIIFMDPPYNHAFEKEVLQALKDSCIADAETLIVIEASLDTDFSYVEGLGFEVLRIKKYKTNQHVFVRRNSGEGK